MSKCQCTGYKVGEDVTIWLICMNRVEKGKQARLCLLHKVLSPVDMFFLMSNRSYAQCTVWTTN